MGVPKQMPLLSARGDLEGTIHQGIQSYRNKGNYTMTDTLKSPFPWPGGKSDVAPAVWARFGQIDNFVEPMCGSAAMLLARPGGAHATETVNDIDGLLINAYRCIQFAPDETAEWCDWPVSEADLTSRHLHLKAAREELTARLFADPFYCDPLLGAFWLWGIASWIGDGWCVADGPWINVDGRLVDRRVVGIDQEGVGLRMPAVGGIPGANGKNKENDRGILRREYRASVPRKMPEIGYKPRMVNVPARGVQAYRHHAGVPKQMPRIGGNVTDTCSSEPGVRKFEPNALAAYFARLSDRLRRVRFLCGDWRRACKDSVTVNHGTTGIFMDSPYPKTEHSMGYHTEETEGDEDVWFQSARWAAEHGDDKRFRIAVCGYMSPACDAMFPSTWERLPWEARGGYANQSKDGRGRTNAKREMIWFSPGCLNPSDEARDAFSRPIIARASDFTGTMFEEDVNV